MEKIRDKVQNFNDIHFKTNKSKIIGASDIN